MALFHCTILLEHVFLIEFFAVIKRLPEIAILASNDFTAAKKKLPPMGLDLVITG